MENLTGETMEAIVSEHEPALLRYASGLLHDPHAAQDVVQNVFIKLFSQWQPKPNPSQSLRAWLFRVTHNEAIDTIRRRKRLEFLHFKHAQEEASAQVCRPEDDRMERVMAAVKRLDMPEQQVVLLRLQEGLSYQEIAAITGRSEGNVGCLLHHAVKKLSRLVQQADTTSGKGGPS